MNKNQTQKCTQILEKLMTWSICLPFIEMVDPEKDNAPDYFDFVKEPMSLNEVKRKLKSGLYTSTDEFSKDINLIWDNAKAYNGEDTLYTYMAMEAKLWFNKKMKKINTPNEIEWTEKMQKTTKIIYKMLANPPKEIDQSGTLSFQVEDLFKINENEEGEKKEEANDSTEKKN